MFQQLKQAVSGAQILFVAFGALVLVPLLTGLNPAMALLGGGIGTLLFQICTGRKVPIFLGSSFAFIGPIIYSAHTWGMPSTMFGLFAAGFMYFVFALLIRWRGMALVNKLLPPVVIGPVIMIIGLSVATSASNMAMGRAGGAQVMSYDSALLLATISLATTIIVSIFARGIFRLVPILAGVTVGYICAVSMGLVDLAKIANAPWFAAPHFITPVVNWSAALFMLPVAIAPAIEHIGGVMAIGGVTGKDYTSSPGLHRTDRWPPGYDLC
jgi:uracil permease